MQWIENTFIFKALARIAEAAELAPVVRVASEPLRNEENKLEVARAPLRKLASRGRAVRQAAIQGGRGAYAVVPPFPMMSRGLRRQEKRRPADGITRRGESASEV